MSCCGNDVRLVPVPNPSIDHSYPRWQQMQADMERYFNKCAQSPKARRLRGAKANEYCARVAWMILRKSGRYSDYPAFRRRADHSPYAADSINPVPPHYYEPYITSGKVIGRLKGKNSKGQPIKANVVLVEPGDTYGLGGVLKWGSDTQFFHGEPGIFFFLDIPTANPAITSSGQRLGRFAGDYYLTTIINQRPGTGLTLHDPEGEHGWVSFSGIAMDSLFEAIERRYPNWRMWVVPHREAILRENAVFENPIPATDQPMSRAAKAALWIGSISTIIGGGALLLSYLWPMPTERLAYKGIVFDVNRSGGTWTSKFSFQNQSFAINGTSRDDIIAKTHNQIDSLITGT
jgi:hypothetical protein